MADKPIGDRVRECVRIVKKLTENLQLPNESPEVEELRAHMNTYIKTGVPWTGTVSFAPWGRIAHCTFPQKASETVEVVLKVDQKERIYRTAD